MGDRPLSSLHKPESLDAKVRRALAAWPQRPPGMPRTIKQPGPWLRARPDNWTDALQPFIKLPGSRHLRTLPDGLWLHFSPDPEDPYVDILCVEACGSLSNLLDKRSRFAPSTGSLQVFCPLPWLLSPLLPETEAPRWRLIPLFREEPTGPAVLPVRDLRVLYGLREEHYQGFALSQMPAPHEFFCPMETLMREDGHEDPALQALIRRASAAANFMVLPEPGQAGSAPPPPPRSPACQPPRPSRLKDIPSIRVIDTLFAERRRA
ncbi:MAG: hypothetical protein N2588_03770 [Rhodovarius sp.]|nr:hypothetical protein [Rhodovarius sp.]